MDGFQDNLAMIISWESQGRWTGPLRRGLGLYGARFLAARDGDECGRLLHRHPASVLIVEFAAERFSTMVRRFQELGCEYAAATAIVLGSSELQPYEVALREAGAEFVFYSTQQLPQCRAVIRRHLGRVAEIPPSFRQSVWSRLPWRKP
jgi:hypothetical protein